MKFCKVIFAEYGLLRQIISDRGPNSIFNTFQEFCKKLNINHAVSALVNIQSNGQVKACIELIKETMKKC